MAYALINAWMGWNVIRVMMILFNTETLCNGEEYGKTSYIAVSGRKAKELKWHI